jgi:catechol 2,3-dioxygenase-like lactoylglutathione lyase family enzyme
MIDHVSIAVRDLAGCCRFYDAALAPLGFRRMIVRPTTIGFGKKYPEFWLNERRAMTAVDVESGAHVALRAPDTNAVDAFYSAALQANGTSDGAPGPRPEYSVGYYAAFVRDPEGNRIEAVTFTDGRN